MTWLLADPKLGSEARRQFIAAQGLPTLQFLVRRLLPVGGSEESPARVAIGQGENGAMGQAGIEGVAIGRLARTAARVMLSLLRGGGSAAAVALVSHGLGPLLLEVSVDQIAMRRAFGFHGVFAIVGWSCVKERGGLQGIASA